MAHLPRLMSNLTPANLSTVICNYSPSSVISVTDKLAKLTVWSKKFGPRISSRKLLLRPNYAHPLPSTIFFSFFEWIGLRMARARGNRSLGLLDFFKNPTNLKIVETLIRFLTFLNLTPKFWKNPTNPRIWELRILTFWHFRSFWHQRIYVTSLGSRDIARCRFLWRERAAAARGGGVGYYSSWIPFRDDGDVLTSPFRADPQAELTIAANISRDSQTASRNTWYYIKPLSSGEWQFIFDATSQKVLINFEKNETKNFKLIKSLQPRQRGCHWCPKT